MRTTVALDDELTAGLLREALTALIQRESARRLALLGGSAPDASSPPRRRSKREPRFGTD